MSMDDIRMLIPWFSLTVTIGLLHLLWLGGFIAAIAAVSNRCLARRPANARYLVHFASLVIMLLCVPATLTVVAIAVPRPNFSAMAIQEEAHFAESLRPEPDLRARQIARASEPSTDLGRSTAHTLTNDLNATSTSRPDGLTGELGSGWIAASYFVFTEAGFISSMRDRASSSNHSSQLKTAIERDSFILSPSSRTAAHTSPPARGGSMQSTSKPVNFNGSCVHRTTQSFSRTQPLTVGAFLSQLVRTSTPPANVPSLPLAANQAHRSERFAASGR
jgi:hypothetical protein